MKYRYSQGFYVFLATRSPPLRRCTFSQDWPCRIIRVTGRTGELSWGVAVGRVLQPTTGQMVLSHHAGGQGRAWVGFSDNSGASALLLGAIVTRGQRGGGGFEITRS